MITHMEIGVAEIMGDSIINAQKYVKKIWQPRHPNVCNVMSQ